MASISTGVYGHFGNFSAANQLPNVAAAPTQSRELQVGDLATVGGALYVCTVATLGAAVWVAIGGSGINTADVYTPVVTAILGDVVADPDPGTLWSYTRVAATGSAGAHVVVTGSLVVSSAAGASGGLATVTFPAGLAADPAAALSICATARLLNGGGLPILAAGSFSSPTAMTAHATLTAGQQALISVVATYNQD